MVGRLVENEKLRLPSQDAGEGYALDLSSAQLRGLTSRLLLSYLHLSEELPVELHILLTLAFQLRRLYSGSLFEVAHLEVIAKNHLAAVVSLLASYDAEQCRLARAVFGYEPYMFALIDGEGDVFKQHSVSYALGESLYFEIWSCHSYEVG